MKTYRCQLAKRQKSGLVLRVELMLVIEAEWETAHIGVLFEWLIRTCNGVCAEPDQNGNLGLRWLLPLVGNLLVDSYVVPLYFCNGFFC